MRSFLIVVSLGLSAELAHARAAEPAVSSDVEGSSSRVDGAAGEAAAHHAEAPLYAPPTVSSEEARVLDSTQAPRYAAGSLLPPLEYRYRPAPKPVHAPRFALWTGVRLTFQTFGNGFFRNELGRSETTGGYLNPGIGTELNVGARLEKRYIPYLLFDRMWAFGTGRRFDGGSAYAQLLGFGFRYVFGNPDFFAGFVDLSFGLRDVAVSAHGQSYSMRSFEFLRMSAGAEIRLHSRFVLSPMITLSSGVMNDTTGTIAYAPGQRDGLTAPRYRDGEPIEESASYLVFAIGTGAHFDLFGK